MRQGDWEDVMVQDDGWLREAGIRAHDAEDGESYLYVPGQLLVAEEDADEVRRDLEEDERRIARREERRIARRLAAPAAFDPPTMRRLGKLLGREGLAELLRAWEQKVKREPDGKDLPRPGQDPAADEALAEVGLVRIHVDEDDDVPGLVTAYRAEGLDVAPNHVVHFEPFYKGGPGSVPVAADGLDAPPEGRGGPRVVVLDTGIQRLWDKDPWFHSRVDAAGGSDIEVLDADGDDALDVQAGHGTFIASLVAMGCPSATIVPRRVLNSFGLTSDADLCRAVLAAARLEPDILNLSLGCYTADDVAPPGLVRALRRLPSRTAVLAAAGNAGQDRVFWPAALKTVVAVGAHDGAGVPARAKFSNHGHWVDACADGLDVHAKFVHWDGGTAGVLDPGDFEGWAVWSGTSFATPIVAGVLAQHMVDHGVGAHDAVQARIRAAGLTTLPGLGVRVD